MATLTTIPADRIKRGDLIRLPDGTIGYVVALQRRIWRVTLALRVSPTEARIISLTTIDPVEVYP